MSRLLLTHRLCSRCVLRELPFLSPRAKPKRADSVSLQAQRRYFGGFAFSKKQGQRLIWVCGVGAGIVLAVGLKYSHDSTKSSCDDKVSKAENPYKDAIRTSRDLLQRIKVGDETEVGAPGLVVGVSVDGVQVWCEGMGYADLENRVPCTPETVMRVASLSKPLTSAAAARLCEAGKLDLDIPVQKYVPEFPQKQFDGQDVTITPRMILSHLSGIRHYEKDAKKVKEEKEKAKRRLKPPVKDGENKSSSEKRNELAAGQKSKSQDSSQARRKKEFEHDEYYLKDNFENVIQSLDLFKDDPLIFKPGTAFLYSTHAFTLLSAVMERAAGQHFLGLMMNLFRELGMLNTVPDENDPIIYHRSRFYCFNKRGRVVNSPYVDNSYKWAGGGFLSTAGDMLLFGNALLYSYQVAHVENTEGLLPGFLKPKTAVGLWAPVDKTEASWDKDGLYAQGWLVVEKLQKYGQCRKRRHYVSHTGGAVGASSVLLVLPSEELDQRRGRTLVLPQGVVVTIITNMQSVALNATALKVALEFDKATRV